MVSRFVTRQLAAAVMGGMLLGGCSDLLSQGVPIPDGTVVADFDTQLDPGVLRNEQPYETIVVGVAYVDRNCEMFFNAVESMGQKTSLLEKAVSVSNSQTQAILAVAKTAAMSVTYVSAGFTLTQSLIDEFQNVYLFAPHAPAIRRMVKKAREAEAEDLATKYRPTTADKGRPRLSHREAMYAVQRYAQNCTISNIMGVWRQAVEKAANDGVQADGPPTNGVPKAKADGLESGGYYRSRRNGGGLLGVNSFTVR